MKKIYLSILALAFTTMGFAQGTRYCDEIFTGVNVTSNVTYGNNISILTGAPAPLDLKLDIYTPEGDTETARPVVLVAHTGSFLPIYFNQQATGSKSDSSVVEICTRLAKRGYVAIPYDYRLGWLPRSTDADTRKGTIIQAAYRGIQDTRTAIRFLKKNAAEGGNTYGIDPSKIAVWGLGTGSYLSMGAATLDRVEEISLAKFISSTNNYPYVIPSIMGNMNGTDYGINPQNGDTLATPNHMGYNSDFQVCVSMGGALGDASWLEGKENEPVMLGVQCPTDIFAPYYTGDVIVPTTKALVISDASGVRHATQLANEKGNNDGVANISSLQDPIAVANQQFNGATFDAAGTDVPLTTDNFYPFVTRNPAEGAPWAWWDPNVVQASVAYLNQNFNANLDANKIHQGGLLTNPNMSAEKARKYIDSTLMLVLPRMSVVFGLGCVTIDVQNIEPSQVGLNVFPNPAQEVVNFKTNDDAPIQTLFIYDINGRLVKAITDIDNNIYQMKRNNLPNGIYFAKLTLEQGVTTQKIILE